MGNSPEKWIGRTIDDYYIEGFLGRGASGLTFRAKKISTGEAVALKLLTPEFGELEPEDVLRFKREIKILKELSDHANIIPLKDQGEYMDSPYLVTAYKNMGNLRSLFNQHKSGLDIETVIKLFKPIASAVDFAHQHDIIHRDLKPENILLQKVTNHELHPYITDFGVAKIQKGTKITRVSSIVGTTNYIAPEMWDEKAPKTHLIDIFALGVMLYEALEGKPPFSGTDLEVQRQHDKGIPYPHETHKRTNRQVAKVLLKALAISPANRYRSATDLMQALEDAYKRDAEHERAHRLQRIGIISGSIFTLLAGLITIIPWLSEELKADSLVAEKVSPTFFVSDGTPTFELPTQPFQSPVPTHTLSPTDTSTATDIPTDTPRPTDTPFPTNTLRPTDTSTATDVPTNTPRPTDTPFPTNTPRPTDTPFPTAVQLSRFWDGTAAVNPYFRGPMGIYVGPINDPFLDFDVAEDGVIEGSMGWTMLDPVGNWCTLEIDIGGFYFTDISDIPDITVWQQTFPSWNSRSVVAWVGWVNEQTYVCNNMVIEISRPFAGIILDNGKMQAADYYNGQIYYFWEFDS